MPEAPTDHQEVRDHSAVSPHAPRGLTALCLHSVGDWQHPMAVPPARFRDQLVRLLERGYRATTFSASVLRPLPGRWLAVTFDDGFRDVHRHAFPILQELGLPGTVFLPTDFVGTRNDLAWPGFDPAPAPAPGGLAPMSWEDVRELADAGWEVGSHSRSHPHLTRLTDERLAEELGASRAVLQERLGVPCTSFAYPFGDADARVVAATRAAGYRAAAGTRIGRQRPGTHLVPRVSVYHGDGTLRFSLKMSRALQSRPGTLVIDAGRAVRGRWRSGPESGPRRR